MGGGINDNIRVNNPKLKSPYKLMWGLFYERLELHLLPYYDHVKDNNNNTLFVKNKELSMFLITTQLK